MEARGFRDASKTYEAAGLGILGISLDSVDSHAQWAEKLELNYPLLADPGGKVARAFGVRRGMGMLSIAARASFLVDGKGIIVKAFPNVEPKGHADEILEAARGLGLI